METAETTIESTGEVGAVSVSPATSLLACPFCGGEPTLVEFQQHRRTYYAVRCECDVMMHTCDDMTTCDCDNHNCGQGWEHRDKAVAAWNTRHANISMSGVESVAERKV